ncbi:MAG: ATP-binding protein [Bacillota bacterium]
MKKEIIKRILVEYQKKRDLKREKNKEKKKKLYKQIPRLKEIDDSIRKHSIKTNKLILKKKKNIKEEIKKLETVISDLKKEKAYILTENNIPLDYLEMDYDCKICKDTGFVKSGKKCKCLKQKIINKYYEMSNLKHKLKTENFKTFNLDIFSNKDLDDYKKSQKENMRHNLTIAEKFTTNFDTDNLRNLLLLGPPGQGKTFLCNCIANSLINKGHLVIYQTAFKLIEIIENVRFNKNNFSNQDPNYQMLFNADLLIIDDLGTEFSNTFTTVEIFNIINSRLNQNKKTIISTNLSSMQIKEKYSDRISSRVFGNYKILKFYGPDLRWEV